MNYPSEVKILVSLILGGMSFFMLCKSIMNLKEFTYGRWNWIPAAKPFRYPCNHPHIGRLVVVLN